MTSTFARCCVVLFVLASACASGCMSGCAKAPPARCPEESAAPQQVNSDEHVRVTTTTLPADPTAAGALKGEARVGARPMRGVVLLDYSGSMYGGYDRPATTSCPQLCKAQGTRRNGQPYYYSDPSFQRFLAALVDDATPAGTSIDLRALLFNKQVWTFDEGKVKPAPTALTFPWSSMMSSSSLAAALATIPPDPFAATGKNADETHIQPALARAVDAVLQGSDEGIVWLVTDNIADQSGGGVSADDARRNLAFYEYLKREPRLQLVYAYPVHDAEQCTWLCGSSLFVYALQVSSRVRADVSEVDRLSGGHLGDGKPTADGVLWNAALQSLTAGHAGSSPAHLAGVPLRLKPMDLNAVSVSFAKTPEGKTQPLRCKRTAEFGDAVPCVATLVVKNNLRHERIDSARLAIEGATLLPRTRESPQRLPWAGAVCAGGIKAVGATAGVDDTGQFVLGPILPGAEQTLQVRLLIPAVTVSPTSPGEIIDVAMTDALLLQGPLTARIRDVHASLVVSAADRRRVYGAEALPQIFTDRSEAEVVARFPVIAVVNNDGKLQALLLVGGLLALLLLLGLLAFVLQPAWCTVLVDGVEADRLRMRRFSSRPVDLRGVRYGQVKRGVGVPVFVPARGAVARRSGSAWLVAPASGSESRIELRQGWRSKKAAAAATGF